MIAGLKIHVEHPLIPAAGAHGMFRIVANRVDYGLHETDAEQLRILRHEDDMTALLESDFGDEVGETRGACQVQVAARLASVAVSARDQRALPNSGQLNYAFIFIPTAHGVELEGMKELGVIL